MISKTLLILESSDIGCRYTADAARELGLRPVFLADLKQYQADTLAQLKAETTIDTSTTDAKALLLTIHSLALDPIAGVVTFLDSRLRVAAELSRLLKTRGHDEACVLLKDKGFVQRLIPEQSPKSLSFIDLPSHEALAALAHSTKVQTFALKPTDAAGAIGYVEIERSALNPETLKARFSVESVASHLRPRSWILQEKIDGRLASLEGFVNQGAVHWLGACGREKIGKTESRLDFPYEEQLTPSALESARSAIKSLVSRSGFRNGYFHVEFIFSESEAYLIDANMGRLGGGPVGEILAEAFEISPVAVFRHVISTTLGLDDPHPYQRPVPLETLGVCYGVADAAILRGLSKGDCSSVRHTQILADGASVPPMGSNNWAWVGIATGRRKDVLDFIGRLTIHTTTGDHEACF